MHTEQSAATGEVERQISPKSDNAFPWQRLAPIAILYFFFRGARRALSASFFLIPALAFNLDKLSEHKAVVIPSVLILLGIILVGAIALFSVYRYRVTENKIEIRSGVFAKKHLDLPFERIQNVKIERPFYYRLTHFCCLELDTAGSAEQEASLVALTMQEAHTLKRQIINVRYDTHQQANRSDANFVQTETCAVQDSENDAENIINTRTLSDLVLHGITNNQVYIFLGVLAPFYETLSQLIAQFANSVGIDIASYFDSSLYPWWQIGLYSLALFFIIMAIIASLSIIGSILVYYGYTLSRTGDRYIRRSGLLSQQEVSMRLSRIQKVISQQDWLDVLLKRSNIIFQQNTAFGTQDPNLHSTTKLTVPSVTHDQRQLLCADALPGSNMFSQKYANVSRFLLMRYQLFVWCPALLIIALQIWHNWQHTPLLSTVIILLVAGMLSLLLLVRWSRWGVAVDDDYIYIRSGLLGVKYTCFSDHKVQQVAFRQTPLMRRNQLASVRLVLASGAVTIPYLTEKEAIMLIDRCLYRVEAMKQSWM